MHRLAMLALLLPVLVNQGNPGSPAERAGLRVGDLITTFDWVKLTDGGDGVVLRILEGGAAGI